MSEPILPTHSCFDDALDYLSWRVKRDKRCIHTLFLVHAICLAPEGRKKDTPFAHAWVEEEVEGLWVAWQDGFLRGQRITYSCDRDALVASLRVQEFTRYTVKQAAEENRRTGRYGPWLPQYEALCGDGTSERFEPEVAP